MIKGIRSLAVTAIALITFLLIGAELVWNVQTWECQCANAECGECALSEEAAWEEDLLLIHAEYAAHYADEFTALFNAYEVKFSKNGRTMIRKGNAGSFKFARKA